MPRRRWQEAEPALHRTVLAYLFERFPKFSQTFCYREIAEMFRLGQPPLLFSLRPADLGPEPSWDTEILSKVHYVPEGAEFARRADEAARSLDAVGRTTLRRWRGRRDSLRLHQAVYLGVRLRDAAVTHLHTHFAGMGARTAFWIQRFFAVPYSVTLHANDLFVPDQFEPGLAEIIDSARAIITVSDFAADFIRGKYPASASRVHRVYNGIDLGEYESPSSLAAPAQILSVGRLIDKKGFDVLIGACRALHENGVEFSCEIIGDGPLRANLQAQIERCALENKVRLIGAKSRSEIAARLRSATLFALPCRVDEQGAMDNLPTVIMEAMAASRPVVSTAVAGIPEMVVHGETGFLVPQNDIPKTAAAIQHLLLNAGLARQFGEGGRLRAQQLFSIESNVRALRHILEAGPQR